MSAHLNILLDNLHVRRWCFGREEQGGTFPDMTTVQADDEALMH
jgi:hypothetical protein